jgi:hypothetical protein
MLLEDYKEGGCRLGQPSAGPWLAIGYYIILVGGSKMEGGTTTISSS